MTAVHDAAHEPRLRQTMEYLSTHCMNENGWAARAELLARTGANDEARQAYEIAIGLERDPAVREFLQRRLIQRLQASDL